MLHLLLDGPVAGWLESEPGLGSAITAPRNSETVDLPTGGRPSCCPDYRYPLGDGV